MSAGRLLGVDYGDVRVGLSVSDPDRKIAFPLATYVRQGRERDASKKDPLHINPLEFIRRCTFRDHALRRPLPPGPTALRPRHGNAA